MKTRLLLFVITMVVVVSCQKEDAVQIDGVISFAVPGPGASSGPLPTSLVISVEDEDGKSILQDKVLPVARQGLDYSTERLSLSPGTYHITKVIVLSGTEASYVTPRTGSTKATLIEIPLPFAFESKY